MADEGGRERVVPAGHALVERDSELGCLHDLLGEVGRSGGRVVLVRGEAGIGKTALISRFLAEVQEQAHVMVGWCDDLLTPQPMGAIRDLARNEPSLSAALAAGGRTEVMERLLDLLSRRLRPTVAVLEDVQWADEATLDVIRFVGRRIGLARGLLVLTYRDGEVDQDHPLRRVIGDIPAEGVVRVRLAPLSAAGVAALLDGTDLDAAEVLALTAGNPLFVTQVAAWGREGVPASVRDVVLARVMRLPPKVRRALEALSVLPGGAAPAFLERIAGPSEEEIAAGMQRGLLQADGDLVRFRHELVRRAVESSLGTEERRALHRRALEAMQEPADPAMLVHHAREAGDAAAILAYAPRAARAAVAVGSHRAALQHFRALEPHLDRLASAEQAALWEDRARSELLVLSPGAAVESIGRAIELYRAAESDRGLARALTFAVRPLFLELSNEEPAGGAGGAAPGGRAEACAAEAVAILGRYPPGPELARALSQQAWLAAMTGDGARASQLADRAFRLADEVGEHWAACHALNTQGLLREGHSEAMVLLEQARRRAEEHGHPDEELRALSNMADAAFEALELGSAIELAQRLRNAAIRYDMPGIEKHARIMLAHYRFFAGDWEAAEHELLGLLSLGDLDDLAAGWPLGSLQARLGRRTARATLEGAWSLAQACPITEQRVLVGGARAEYLWLAEEDDSHLVAQLLALMAAVADLALSPSAGVLPFWLWQLGHLPSIPGWVAPPWRLIDGRPLEAAALWQQGGFPYQQGLALMHAGAEEQLQALRIFERLGASVTAARLRRLLATKGIRPPRGQAVTTRHHPAGLTTRQAEVLQLLAEGCSSPEIADRLFISPRTAESHVAAILMKLDVADRSEAVAAARAQGLLAAG